MALPQGSINKALQIRDELGNTTLTKLTGSIKLRLPALEGGPICLLRVPGLRDGRGPVHAGSFLRERRIAFDCTQAEFPRILVHELFHFVWLRLGNPARWSWEKVLAAEHRRGARGELGWSAQWRKDTLAGADTAGRTRAWRLYCCESFCDTAAYLYSGCRSHPEFTLAENMRHKRRGWFEATIEKRRISI